MKYRHVKIEKTGGIYSAIVRVLIWSIPVPLELMSDSLWDVCDQIDAVLDEGV